MKLEINQSAFLKYWTLAEKITGPKTGSIPTLASVLVEADEKGVTLSATNLKTTIRVSAEGVTVIEPGRVILPAKLVGELFKKIPVSPFTVEVSEEKGTIVSGRSRYRFTTYITEDFPDLPYLRNGEEFAKITAGELDRVLKEGKIAGAPNDDFPRYLSGALFQLDGGELRVVSTDGRRLSLSKTHIENGGEASQKREMLLPLKALGDFQSILSSFDPSTEVEVLQDGSVTFFNLPGVRYTVRCIDSQFPSYERLIGNVSSTQMNIRRQPLNEALDRINVVVSDDSRVVRLTLSPGAPLELSGRAPEIGEAHETVDAEVTGAPLKVAFNVKYLLDGIKEFGDEISLSFNGVEGQMVITRPNGTDFIYMLMPIKMKEMAEDGASDQSEEN